MLRNVGVRTKLLGIIAVPMAFLLAVTGALVLQGVSAARQAERVRTLTEASAQLNLLVHGFQAERSATMRYLSTRSPQDRAAMMGIRTKVDGGLGRLRTVIADSPVDKVSPEVAEAVVTASRQHDGLRAVRESVDSTRYFETEVENYYDRVIATDLSLPGLVAESAGDSDLAQELRAYQALSSLIEAGAKERDVLGKALRLDRIGRDDFVTLSGYVAEQNGQLDTFRRLASADQSKALSATMARSNIFGVEEARRQAADLLLGKPVPPSAAAAWATASTGRLDALSRFEASIVKQIAAMAGDAAGDARRKAALNVFVALLGLGLAVIVTVALARRMVRPLRRLTVAAALVGDELPKMVERMQTPGEGPGVEIEPIPIESRDEIGQLAEAFNTVNDVTVRVAQEQAALRASIAEMFVNVARRNQVLLGRQLSQIDQMEAREEDPDVLENLFKLDHLATRMRRNAESLLVLAGIDATRRLRNPLPLSDVIRTAVSEIEAFDRVDLSLPQDPDVSGRLALTTAHLLAELLENATHFSNPDTRVVVSAALTGNGVDLTITDYGLGMSDEEIAEANRKIAEPPVAEIAVSQRLGLFVVGRLAQRLGATVTLRRGRAGGTVVTVALPDDVFMNMDRPSVDSTVPAAEPPVAVSAPDVSVAEPAPVPVDVVEDEPAEETEDEAVGTPAAAVLDQPTGPSARRRRLLPRRGQGGPEPVTAEPAAADQLTVEDEDVESVRVLQPAGVAAREAEAGPEYADPAPAAATMADVVAEPAEQAEPAEPNEPAKQAEPAAVHAPVPAPAARPEARPAARPAMPGFAFAPAVDILPGRPMTSRAEARPVLPAPEARLAPPAAPPVVVPGPAEQPPAPSAPPAPSSAVPSSAVPFVATPASAPAPAASGLAARATGPAPRPQAAPAPAEPVPPVPSVSSVPSAPPVPAQPRDLDRLAADAQLHSTALSELRGLYEPSYAPQAVTPRPVAEGLARRTPKSSAAPTPSTPAPADVASTTQRTRSAVEVRGMLSGFRAGVERGRTTPQTTPDTNS